MENGHNNIILTVAEVAEYLKLAERTVLRLVHDNTLPAARVGNQWRFLKSVIDEWLIKSMNIPEHHHRTSYRIRISELINPEFIITDLRPGDKASILNQLAAPLVESGIITSSLEFVRKLAKREKMSSTGIGDGIAFPHLRNPGENPENGPSIVTGICREGTDFDSIDGEKVCLFFLLCLKNETSHIKVMSQLSFLLKDTALRNSLSISDSADEFIEILKTAEDNYRE